MQLKTLLFAVLPALALAQNNDSDNSSTGPIFVVSSTTTGIVVQSSVVPVVTTVRDTSTVVGVGASTTQLSRVTNVVSSPTATNVLYTRSTQVSLAGPYFYTTNAAGSTYITVTGTPNASQSSYISTATIAVVTSAARPTTTSSSVAGGAYVTALPGVAAVAAGFAAFMV